MEFGWPRYLYLQQATQFRIIGAKSHSLARIKLEKSTDKIKRGSKLQIAEKGSCFDCIITDLFLH